MVLAEHHNPLISTSRMAARFPGFGGTNPTDSRVVRVARVQLNNQHGILIPNFFHSESTDLKWKLQDGSEIAFQKPGNPYGPPDMLVVGSTPELHQAFHETIDGIFPNDLTPQGRYKYWQTALNQLVAQEYLPSPNRIGRNGLFDFVEAYKRRHDEKPRLYKFSGENVTPLSYFDSMFDGKYQPGEAPGTGKTIALPHRHGTVLLHDWLTPDNWSIDHVDHQQQLLQRLQGSELGNALFQRIYDLTVQTLDSKQNKERFQHSVGFAVEREVPYGYSLTFTDIKPKRGGMRSTDTEFFVEVMRAHHIAYSHAMHDLESALSGTQQNAPTKNNPLLTVTKEHGIPFAASEITLPQPCYQDYLLFTSEEKRHDKKLLYRVSPQISSSAGLLETSGVKLDRAPDYPSVLPEKQAKLYRRRLIRKVWKYSKRDERYVDIAYDNRPRGHSGRRKHFDAPDYIPPLPKI